MTEPKAWQQPGEKQKWKELCQSNAVPCTNHFVQTVSKKFKFMWIRENLKLDYIVKPHDVFEITIGCCLRQNSYSDTDKKSLFNNTALNQKSNTQYLGMVINNNYSKILFRDKLQKLTRGIDELMQYDAFLVEE